MSRAAPETARAWFRDADYEPVLAELARVRTTGPWRDAWRRFLDVRSTRWGLRWLAGLWLLALLAPLLPLPAPAAMDLALGPVAPVAPWARFSDQRYEHVYARLGPVDAALVGLRERVFGKLRLGHWLGTDSKGRDTLARILWGSRTSLAVALFAAVTSVAIGLSWGAVAGISGGRVDNLMMRVVDVLQSIPTIFVVIFLLSFLNPPRTELVQARLFSREQVFFLVIGAVSWLSMARVVRGQVLALRSLAFIESARAQGASTAWIVRAHLVPSVLPIVLVYVTLTLPSVILYEAFLSFLGLGVEAPGVSWGLLAADGAQAINPLQSYWWLLVGPALVMATTLLALGVIGDGLRDAFDPRSSER